MKPNKIKRFIKIFSTGKKDPDKPLADFYKVAAERQCVLDAFIDHGLHLCSSKNLEVITFSKALPAQDIKYIYDRISTIEKIFKKRTG